MITEKFGNRVQLLRKEKNLSQEKFALLIGMDRTYYASVEKGRRNISIKLVNYLKTFNWEENMNNSAEIIKQIIIEEFSNLIDNMESDFKKNYDKKTKEHQCTIEKYCNCFV